MHKVKNLPITAARVIVTCPGRNFVTLKLDLAVSIPRRLLAARSGNHECDCRGGHGAVGHQGEGRRHASIPTPGRGLPHRRAGLRARKWRNRTRNHRGSAALSTNGLHRDPTAIGSSRTQLDLRRIARQDVLRACERRFADGEPLVQHEVPRRRAGTIRGSARRTWMGDRLAARQPSPVDADRSGALGEGFGTAQAILAGRHRRGGQSSLIQVDSPTHDHTACGRGSLQQHLGLQTAHRGATHRLYSCDRGACGRHQPPAARGGARRSLSCQDRLSWSDGFVAGLHGCGIAFRFVRTELRHPGIHAPHERNRRGVSARV